MEERFRVSRGKTAGIKMAEAIVEFCNIMYNANTAKRVIRACIERLEFHYDDFTPVKKGGS